MAKNETSKDLLAGIFLLTGIGLFFLSLLVLGRERNLFGVFVPLTAYYADVRGLNVGAPVRFGGIPVGRVASIDLSSDISDARVAVTIDLQEQYLNRVRTDSTASIETQGLLGDKFINISTNGSATILPAGGVLKTREAVDLNNVVSKVEQLVEEAGAGIKSVSDLARSIDTNKINKSVDEFHKITASLGASSTLADLSEIVREIKTGSGILNTLIFPSPAGEKLDRSLKSFAQVATNLEQITLALSQGSGTLGALLIDSRVYDNLVEVTDDAKRSYALRSVVRSALNEKKE